MNRRSLLVATGVAALTGTVPARAAPPLDLDSPAGRLAAFMRMRGALDGRLVIGCLVGRYHGVVGDEARPLYGVVSATFSRYRRRADGGFDGAGYEVSFFTDPDSGDVLERYANPYTGETVDVPRANYPAAAFTVTPGLEIVYPKPPPGLVARTRVLAPQAIGDDVWFTEEITSALTVPGADRPVRYGELTTLHAKRADLAAGLPRVPAQTDFTAVVSWRPWLRMGDRPGHLMGVGHGRFVDSPAELPAAFRAACAKYRPQVLTSPDAPLQGLLA